MKRKFIVIAISLINCVLFAKPLKFKGYPTKIQFNEDKSLLLEINDDYDFHYYKVLPTQKDLKCIELTDLRKKDVTNNSLDMSEKYSKSAVLDSKLKMVIEKCKRFQENEFLANTGMNITLHTNYIVYHKDKQDALCILNFDDGEYEYFSKIIILEGEKYSVSDFKKGNILFCSEIESNNYFLVYYNVSKDRTHILGLALDEIKKLKLFHYLKITHSTYNFEKPAQKDFGDYY